MSDVYIAGSLLHVYKSSWKIYEKIGNVVENFGLKAWIPHIHTADGLDPHGNELDSIHVFNKNVEIIRNSKMVIAEVTNPSTGTGIEIGTALNLNKPVICLVHKDAKLTRMVRGPVLLGLIELIIYENEEDALIQLKSVLENKFKQL